jgi:putative endonuclease
MQKKNEERIDVSSDGRKTIDNKSLGAIGENAAVARLKSESYRILARNQVLPGGELDVIAEDGDAIVFVEVKTRLSVDVFKPRDNITFDKVNRLKKLAQIWLKRNKRYAGWRVRFDVVEVLLDGETLDIRELTLHRRFFD